MVNITPSVRDSLEVKFIPFTHFYTIQGIKLETWFVSPANIIFWSCSHSFFCQQIQQIGKKKAVHW